MAACLGSLFCSVKIHHRGRWQQIFIRNVSVHFSIRASCCCANVPVLYADKRRDVPTYKRHCWWCFRGDVLCLPPPKHPKSYILVSSELFPPSVSRACLNVVQHTCKCTSACFSFSSGALLGERAHRPWWLCVFTDRSRFIEATSVFWPQQACLKLCSLEILLQSVSSAYFYSDKVAQVLWELTGVSCVAPFFYRSSGRTEPDIYMHTVAGLLSN